MKLRNKIYIDYDDVLEMVKQLEYEISKLKPDAIVGITRGGLTPAVHLSHALDVPLFTHDWSTRDNPERREFNETIDRMIRHKNKTVVFVDDINDSGRTFIELKELYKQAKFACMIEKESSEFDSDVSALKLDDERWIVFPWEKD